MENIAVERIQSVLDHDGDGVNVGYGMSLVLIKKLSEEISFNEPPAEIVTAAIRVASEPEFMRNAFMMMNFPPTSDDDIAKARREIMETWAANVALSALISKQMCYAGLSRPIGPQALEAISDYIRANTDEWS